jgi:hypothetical protein
MDRTTGPWLLKGLSCRVSVLANEVSVGILSFTLSLVVLLIHDKQTIFVSLRFSKLAIILFGKRTLQQLTTASKKAEPNVGESN